MCFLASAFSGRDEGAEQAACAQICPPDRFYFFPSLRKHGQCHVLSVLDLLRCLGYSQRLPSLLDLHVSLQIVL